MAVHLAAHSRGRGEAVLVQRHAFAAKVRIVRAVLGWSQTELGRRMGLTQRAIHKLEQGETEPRRATMRALKETWTEQCIEFEDLADGGFRVNFHPNVFGGSAKAKSRRTRS